DLAEACLRGPGPHQAPVMEFLEQAFGQATRAEWEARLEALDMCFGGVNTLPQALQDPHTQARAIVMRDADGRPHIGSPIRLLHEHATSNLESPQLDQHRDLRPCPERPRAGVFSSAICRRLTLPRKIHTAAAHCRPE